MKKLALYILFLSSILMPAFCFAEVPTIIGGNTIKDICKIADCSDTLDIYYRQHYLAKPINKVFVIDVLRGGKAIGGAYMGWSYPSWIEAKQTILSKCKIEFGTNNCQVLFVNNKIADKELYELLTRKSISTTTSYEETPEGTGAEMPAYGYKSGNTLKCKTGYRSSGGRCIFLVPKYAYASGDSFKCIYGYKKSGNSCIKSNNKITTLTSDEFEAEYQAQQARLNEDIKNQNTAVVEESTDYIEELKKIKELLDSGVINEEEFKKIKQKIIDNM